MLFKRFTPHHTTQINHVTRLALIVLAVLLLPLLPAHGAKRILLVGDSWTQWPYDMGSFQAALNHNFGAGVYEVEGEYTALGGSTAKGWAENFVPDEGTFPSPPGHSNMAALNRITWCLNQYPTIDIIHLCISGNDMWSWRANWTAEQENTLFAEIAGNVRSVIQWIRTNHPRVKICLSDYDYLNITETCTWGMQEYSDTSVLFAASLGFTVNVFDIWQNKANNQVLNGFFSRFTPAKLAVSREFDRCGFVQNWGNIQWRAGYTNSLGQVFAAQTVPFPGIAPDYSPMPGGDISYGTPSLYMNAFEGTKRDPIHLSNQGYRLLFDNCIMQYYAGWLTDTTAPLVQSVTLASPNPTAAGSVSYLVTFTENVRGVDAGDFALSGTASTGAAISSVAGADNSPTRTVTVDISACPDGTLRLDFIDNGSVYDANWNAIGGEGAGNGNHLSGPSYLIDRGAPTATVSAGVPEPTELTATPFTVTFSENVSGFSASDVVLTLKSGNGSAQVSNFSGSGGAYTFTVLVERTETITVEVKIPAGAAVDQAGYPTPEAKYLDGADDAYQFDFNSGPGQPGNLYASSGLLGDLTLAPGAVVTINTGNTPPTFVVGANPPLLGKVFATNGGNVAKFEFGEVDVAAGVAVNVTGARPLVIAASGDMRWNTSVDVSGNLSGRAGGGVGGAGGAGGLSAAGGNGGTGAGAGGAQVSGGSGSPNKTTDLGNGIGNGASGTGRASGSQGASGTIGTQGNGGSSGFQGFTGFASMGTAGTGGGGGGHGTPQSVNNGGSGASASGGAGNGGTFTIIPINGGTGGGGGAATQDGVNGGNGSSGANGLDGSNGSTGNNASFTSDASSLLIAAGNGGGGGGGGGSGAGGQGGGQAGGGSSGASGGGGGLGYTTHIAQCNTPGDGPGGAGGHGGAGGAGGAGGRGGNSPAGGNGGSGGNGGGAVALAARGLLTFGGTVDISAQAPASGGLPSTGLAGNAGTNPGNNWSAGGGGSAGSTGVYYTSFAGCWPTYITGGAGGAGTRGGAGGVGGTGGSSGASGGGGNGGLGTPGMVKLHASVIQAQSGNVLCNNHTGDTSDNLRGRATFISNMAAVPQPSYSDNITPGSTNNDLLLKATAPYSPTLQTPLIPQLENGADTGGLALPIFWNQSQAASPGVDLLEMVRLSGANSPFAGFDQLFLVNNGGADAEGVVLTVQGHAPHTIGTIQDGRIWTTTVPAGVPVSFTVAMEVAIPEGDQILYSGQPLNLTAAITGGVGEKTCQWSRNGVVIQTGASTSLVIPALSVTDTGLYLVSVTDEISQTVTSETVDIAVAAPLNVTVAPQNASVITGGNHVFTVAASGGHGSLVYDWRRNSVSLGAPSHPFLTISSASAADEGTYDVVISDAVGMPPNGQVTTPSGGALLTVTNPLVVSGPTPVSAYTDTAQAIFTVSVSGGVPEYQHEWRKNGVALPPGEQPGGPALTLSAPLAGKAGDYDCVVRDSGAPVTSLPSNTAALTVHGHLSILAHPQGGTHPIGDSVTLSVIATGGIPQVDFLWRKNGTALPVERQPFGPMLLLTNIQNADAGDYDVLLRDAGGEEAVSQAATIAIGAVEPLQITGQPQGGTVTAGDSFTFTVQTEGGSGTVHYQWKFDNGQKAAVNIGGDGNALELVDVQTDDSGAYWVEITDNIGTTVSNQAVLTVNETAIPASSAGLLALLALAVAVAGAGRARK